MSDVRTIFVDSAHCKVMPSGGEFSLDIPYGVDIEPGMVAYADGLSLTNVFETVSAGENDKVYLHTHVNDIFQSNIKHEAFQLFSALSFPHNPF